MRNKNQKLNIKTETDKVITLFQITEGILKEIKTKIEQNKNYEPDTDTLVKIANAQTHLDQNLETIISLSQTINAQYRALNPLEE